MGLRIFPRLQRARISATFAFASVISCRLGTTQRRVGEGLRLPMSGLVSVIDVVLVSVVDVVLVSETGVEFAVGIDIAVGADVVVDAEVVVET